MTSGPFYISPVAESTPFDNSSNGFVSENVQDAIEEVNAKTGVSSQVLVPAGQTITVDSFDFSGSCLADYFFCSYNASSTLVTTQQLRALNINGIVKDQVFAKSGSSIDIDFNTSMTGSSFECDVTNNEVYDVTVSLTRRAV